MKQTVVLAILIGIFVLSCSTAEPVPAGPTSNIDATVEAKAKELVAAQRTSGPTLAPVPQSGSAYLIGDGHVGSSPEIGWIFSCATQFRDGRDHTGDWVKDGYWYPGLKISVLGENDWTNAWFNVEVKDGRRVLTGNGLSVGHRTGNFPIARNDPAYQFDTNPNAITEQTVEYSLPLRPNLASTPSCIPMGLIGVATNGVAFYNGLDAAGRDAVAHEVQDSCSGHPERDGQYHYHGPGACHDDAQARVHSLAGYALDGFSIFGLYDDQGDEITNADLNECHGHSHEVTLEGERTESFHYHLTNEYPYTLGCFMGDDVVRARMGPLGQQGQAVEPPLRRGSGGEGGPGGLADAAERLGISEQALRDALGPPPPDIAGAAQRLGISEEVLREAMGHPPKGKRTDESGGPLPRRGPGGEGGPGGLADAAERLGISEQALRDALGPPPPGIAGAAQRLGISEETLRQAMGSPQDSRRPVTPCPTTTDSSVLQRAIAEAAPGDTVTIPAGVHTLSSGQLVVRQDLILVGEGADLSILEASPSRRQKVGRVLLVEAGNVSVEGITLRNGRTSDVRYSGGGIYVGKSGVLSIYDSIIEGNQSEVGGGIYNEGELRLIGTVVRDNLEGGGIHNAAGGVLTIEDSLITGNSDDSDGGGITNKFGKLIIKTSTISENYATGGGGNIWSGGGGIYNDGELDLDHVIVKDNSTKRERGGGGGGLFIRGGVVTLSNSTINGNYAANGAGIYNHGLLTVTSSTLSGNYADFNGGAMCVEGGTVILENVTVSNNFAFDEAAFGCPHGDLTIKNSTITANHAEGAGGAGAVNRVTLINSIFAWNSAPLDADCRGSATSFGNNILGANCVRSPSSNDLIDVDPKLGPLQDNGGSTFTHALLEGSPAVDAANTRSAPKVDQRGVARPQGAASDIGAYELTQ